MNKQELTAMVARLLETMEPLEKNAEPMVKGGDYRPTDPGPQPKATPYREGDFVPDVTELDLRKLYLTEDPANPQGFRSLKEKTPARLGSGRAGPRYKTLTMLRFRADHAAAQDAVFSQVDEDYAARNGMTEVQTRCHDKEEYLTRPDLGRCFDEENARKIREAIPGTPRVQLVIGDGLSSAAIMANAMDCLEAIREGLKLRGIATTSVRTGLAMTAFFQTTIFRSAGRKNPGSGFAVPGMGLGVIPARIRRCRACSRCPSGR